MMNQYSKYLIMPVLIFIGQSVHAIDDIDAMLDDAQNKGNIKLNTVNQTVKKSIVQANEEYQKGVDQASQKVQSLSGVGSNYSSNQDGGSVLTDLVQQYVDSKKQTQEIKTKQLQAQQEALTRAQEARVDAQLQAQKAAYANTLANLQNSINRSNASLSYSSSGNSTAGLSSSGYSNSTSNTINRNKKTASPVNQCISFDQNSNSMADFLVNRCGQKIYVQWFSQGNCATGCGDNVTTKSSISKNKGRIIYAACPDGYSAYQVNAPTSSSVYRWKGSGAFECVHW